MPRIPAYERDPYLLELQVEVLFRGEEEGRPFVVLDDTLLYPQGGGQPADRGLLGAAEVVDVQSTREGVRHYLSEAVLAGRHELRLDWGRRYDHMQQHTAQHLLTAVAADRFGWQTTSFHLGESVADIELDVQVLGESDRLELEEAVMAEVRAHRPVTTRRVSRRELAGLPVRSRGLPAGHEGEIRLVEIEGIDLNTCGGTHLRSTAEVEAVKLLHTERMRGGTRLHWVAGGRVRRRLAEHEERSARLRGLLETHDQEIPSVVATKLEQLRQATRERSFLVSELAKLTAQSLAATGEPVVDAHYEELGPEFLKEVARQYRPAQPDAVLFLTARRDGQSFFLLATGDGKAAHAQPLGSRVAELLEGRGGGSGRIYQGRAGSLSQRPRALAMLQGE